MNKTLRYTCLALLIGNLELSAEPLVTDRPDFTESNQIVKNATQIESGYTFSDTTESEHVVGEILVRHGINSKMELRIGLPSYVSVGGDDTVSGLTDSSIGVKLKFAESTAWIIGSTLPTGSDDFKDDAFNPFLKWCATTSLSDTLSLSTNVGFQSIGADDTQTTQATGSLSLAASYSEKIGTYYEYYVISPVEKGGPTAGHFNLGTTYLVSDNLQLDARIGKDLSQTGYFLGFGVAYKR